MSNESSPNPLVRGWNRVQRRYSANRNRWLGAALVVGLFLLNVVPFVVIVLSSFRANGTNLWADLTLRNWRLFVTNSGPVIVNTFVFTVGAATLTTFLAGCVAWVIARTNAPLRRVYYFSIFLVFFYPPVVIETVWIRLLGDNGLYPALLGFETFHIYSMVGMIVVQSIRMLPIGMILLIPLFGSIDRTLEDASRLSGAGLLQTLRYVTGPLLLPGLSVVFVFTFLITLESFRVPLIIGLPAEIPVLAIKVYQSTNVPPIDYGVAMVQAVFLVGVAIPLLYLYKRMLGKTNQYVTVSGEGFVADSVDVGRWRYVYSALTGLFIFVTVIVPGLFMVYNSLLPYYMPPHVMSAEQIISSITFEGYTAMIGDAELIDAAANSFLVAFIAAFLLTGTGIVIAWVVNKSSIEYRKVIDYLAFFPIGIPAVSLALAMMVMYLKFLDFVPIYGTIAIFLVAFYIKYIPSNVRTMETAVLQVDTSLLEAGAVSGASTIRSIYSLLVPVIFDLTRISWILSFSFIAMEMPIVMMLRSPDTPMISSVLYRISNQATTHAETYAFGVSITLLFIVVVLLLHATKYKRFNLFRW
ncbi:iron(III) transport system permease protein [Halarchaeum rubridurum]|uniref:Iron dicitrate ABC transporter permease n=1 Tax=Halarchaeum rubridurum TaxID=489911 RepID=A0A830FYZ1_9EURY|nr:ABC transporter permease subunit [Halarchaeum rubridurum]MBP1954681.1 iron(III) transport system permease protein [Halarchaeum rubridurum]GGM62974.1 iron dicitrate ABC transporter permease [Halarchaeum rubridurum]